MRKWLMFLGLPCALMAGVRTKDEYHALSHGAEACEALKVVDETGAAVTNATVMGNFHMHDGKGNPFTGHTDTGGVYVASGKCVGDWHYVIKKEGHYETSVDVRYFGPTNTSVRNGRWQPYGLTNTVVLKRKVNPVAMCVHRGELDKLALPELNAWTGFDLECADWVSPHGKGKHEDFQVFFRRGETDTRGRFQQFALTFRFSKPFDGCYLARKDKAGSQLRCDYQADTNRVYDTEVQFSYERTTDQNGRVAVKDSMPTWDTYLVLRVRSETDKEGRLIKANYAKIYAPIFAAYYGFQITTYFNPEPQNPSLEADTTKNLLNPGDLGFAP